MVVNGGKSGPLRNCSIETELISRSTNDAPPALYGGPLLLCCGESHSRLTGFPLAVSECLSLESREAWRIVAHVRKIFTLPTVVTVA